MDNVQLSSRFSPLSQARAIIQKTHADAAPVAKTAMEVFLMSGLWESYLQGLKDGVLLAYSQDVEQGNPLTMEGKNHGPVPSTTENTQRDQTRGD